MRHIDSFRSVRQNRRCYIQRRLWSKTIDVTKNDGFGPKPLSRPGRTLVPPASEVVGGSPRQLWTKSGRCERDRQLLSKTVDVADSDRNAHRFGPLPAERRAGRRPFGDRWVAGGGREGCVCVGGEGLVYALDREAAWSSRFVVLCWPVHNSFRNRFTPIRFTPSSHRSACVAERCSLLDPCLSTSKLASAPTGDATHASGP